MRSARQGARRAQSQQESELGRAAVRITRTQVRARIVPPQELHAEAVLALEPLESGVRTLIFELSRYLAVSSVTADEQPAEFIQNEALQGSDLARRGNDLVAVVLPQPLVAGRSIQLRIRYAGPVMSEAGGGLMYVGARGTWYPNRGPAMSQFELEFRYPTEWTLLATGKRVSQETVDGEQVARWNSERPIPLAGFNLGKYVGSKARAGNTVVESFASHGVERDFPKQPVVVAPAVPGRRRQPMQAGSPPPPSPIAQAQSVAQASAGTIEFLSRRIGPFPYSSLTLSQMPGRDSLGWPGLVFLTSYAFLRSGERRRLGLTPYEDILFGELVQAHETAHQWWGDAVFWKSYRDVWLIEALANYSALLEIERQRPAAFRTVMEEYRRDLLRESKGGRALKDVGPVTLGRRLVSSRFPDGYEVVAYGRGTWLLHMLRHLLRDATPAKGGSAADPDARFFQVLHTLRRRFEGRELSTADLQKAFEEALPAELHFEGKPSLDWFFEGWIQGTAVPRFELEDVRFSSVGGKRTARGKLLQKDAPDTLITSVPLYAATASGNVFVGRVFADGPETEFRLIVPADARKLLVDPLLTILTRP
jgi:aminopeptidase N